LDYGNEIILFAAVTSTGRPCYWVVKPRGRNPAFVTEKVTYRGTTYFQRRVAFDPRPTRFQNNEEISPEKLRTLIANLEEKSPHCLWLHHLKPPQDADTTSSTQVTHDISLEEVVRLCSEKLWSMNLARKTHTEPFEIPGNYISYDLI